MERTIPRKRATSSCAGLGTRFERPFDLERAGTPSVRVKTVWRDVMRMTRHWSIAKGDQREAERARHEFCADLTGSADGLFDAELIFGELVANAVKCARSSVSVELVIKRNTTLRVTDDGDCFDLDSIGPKPYYSVGGRGLYIVQSLARRLTVNLADDKCEVTAVLPL